jgi:hypothetical protein
MALCVLTASWKTSGLNGAGESSGFIDAIMGYVPKAKMRQTL